MPKERNNILIVVSGPTAVGKTNLAIGLAQHFGCEIVNADSRQIYVEMHIGTAKPSAEELLKAKHHLIGSRSIDQLMTAGQYEKLALEKIQQLFESSNKVILTGGTGLYIKAVLEGLDEFPAVAPADVQYWEQIYANEGVRPLQLALKESDSFYASTVDIDNHRRLIRALSVIRTSGRPFSSFLNQERAPRPFKVVKIQLEIDRDTLYDRINLRVDQMIEKGLIEEARILYPKKGKSALQTVGYQELFDFFDGKIDYSEAVRLIKRNSRRYAKRQLTWFRNDGGWRIFGPEKLKEIIEYIENQP